MGDAEKNLHAFRTFQQGFADKETVRFGEGGDLAKISQQVTLHKLQQQGYKKQNLS